jgi:uncharacterized cupin superfamily protein
MNKIIHTNLETIPAAHKSGHKDYEYYKHPIIPRDATSQCVVSVNEIPPGKSAYPYHYHTQNEEVYYIISGSGTLKTPSGDRAVSAGDFLFFPADESGAHKLTNASESEMLVYIDFDTKNDIDIAFYPDSGKIGIWGKGINQLYKVSDKVDYYENE